MYEKVSFMSTKKKVKFSSCFVENKSIMYLVWRYHVASYAHVQAAATKLWRVWWSSPATSNFVKKSTDTALQSSCCLLSSCLLLSPVSHSRLQKNVTSSGQLCIYGGTCLKWNLDRTESCLIWKLSEHQ